MPFTRTWFVCFFCVLYDNHSYFQFLMYKKISVCLLQQHEIKERDWGSTIGWGIWLYYWASELFDYLHIDESYVIINLLLTGGHHDRKRVIFHRPFFFELVISTALTINLFAQQTWSTSLWFQRQHICLSSWAWFWNIEHINCPLGSRMDCHAFFFFHVDITGDGRCLFRSVVYGASLRAGKACPTEKIQRELADELREKVWTYFFFFSFPSISYDWWYLHMFLT